MLELSTHIVYKLQRTGVLVLGCSAGGFDLLTHILQALPPTLPYGVLAVIHRNARYETHLEKKLADKCAIGIKAAADKEPIESATAYFAPTGYHLLVEPNRSLSLDVSEPVHFCRPSIDVTMQSAADVYGPATAAILLSGANKDGAMGMMSIHRAGGLCIAQDPRYAEIDTMPAAAVALGGVHLILRNDELIIFSKQLSNYTFRN